MKRAIDLGDRPPTSVGVMILLDRSGSMKDIKDAMEAEFQSFLAQQRAASPDGMWVSLHQFDGGDGGLDFDTVYDREPLATVGTLQLKPRGWTPLRDALCRFAQEARKVIDDPADETERLLLVIVTDGEENRSRHHSWAEVRELMQGLESAQVETVWLGTSAAIMEAQSAVPSMAAAGATVSYAATDQGVAYAYGGLRAATASMRAGVSSREAVSSYVSGDDRTEELLDALRKRTKA